jgi:hypothetical protein
LASAFASGKKHHKRKPSSAGQIAEQQKAEQDEKRQTELFNKKIASQQDYANAIQSKSIIASTS